MSIVLQSSSGGSVTIQEPTTASNFTVTLPAAAGTAMVSGNQPAFSVYKTGGSQAITNSTYTKIQFNTEVFDTNNNFDSTTNYRFTPTVEGYYQITVSTADGTGFTSGFQFALIYKNGTAYAQTLVTASIYGLSANVSAIIYCNGSTDYIEGYYYQQSGGNTVLDQNRLATFMTGCLVRSA